ncbi:putative sulfate exporter family transporter, partial [Candidatus Bathyarchaeota archaeon]|nr:putative sulfate exporter family transporter [Candidatus Bathyarchaeota archaeon]
MVKVKVDWSSLYRNEDWWAVWLGFIILGLATTRIITWIPKVAGWTTDISVSVKVAEIPYFILLGFCLLLLTSVAIKAMKGNIKRYWVGFPMVFFFALVSFLIAKQRDINYLGLEYVLWALIIGLLISNTIGVPQWLKQAVKTELFIKIGLVLLGAEILFHVILKGGAVSMIQALIVFVLVWYLCFFLATKVGLSKSFATVMATGVSICGVSAAIAAGGAIKGDRKEISYTISMVLLTSVAMLVGEPFIAKLLMLPSSVAGAWLGGTIDTTGAVVAAGALYSDTAMAVAAVVKLSQNVLIGAVAFILSLYWTLRVEQKPGEKPSILDIWSRFPKFIVGFIFASIIFSFLLIPTMGEVAVGSILGV